MTNVKMKATLVEPDDFVVVDADQRDFREWELYAITRKPPLPPTPSATAFPQTLWVARLAFTAARRAGAFAGEWAEWDRRCTDVDVDTTDEPAPDPTPAGATPA